MHLLIANPAAQSGRNEARIERALRALENLGLRTDFLPTRPEGQTISLVRDALQQGDYQCVISMGGDGTLREVAQGLMESGRQAAVTLGLLPAGTANNHGRSFGLDASEAMLEKNAAIIANGHETQLDVGKIEIQNVQTLFIDSVGFGIGARVISRRNVERQRFAENQWASRVYRDKRVYTVATLQTLWTAGERDEFGVTITTDGQTQTLTKLTELLVKGTRVYAGSWVIDRESRHDDGLFEVVAYTNNREWVTKGLVDLVGSDKLDTSLQAFGVFLPKPFRFSRMSLEFHSRNGLPLPAVQVDGELFPLAERADIEVLPRALRLLVP